MKVKQLYLNIPNGILIIKIWFLSLINQIPTLSYPILGVIKCLINML